MKDTRTKKKDKVSTPATEVVADVTTEASPDESGGKVTDFWMHHFYKRTIPALASQGYYDV